MLTRRRNGVAEVCDRVWLPSFRRAIIQSSPAASTKELALNASSRRMVVAEIIETDGFEALNTNRIAEQAGIAIGTLYGYFPNKGAILLAMARRELQATQQAIRAAVDAADPGLDSSRAAIRALLRAFGGRNRLRRVLLEAVVAHGRYVELAQPVEDLAHAILDRGGKGLFPRLPSGLTEIQAFVLTRALVGVIRAAVFEESAFMGSSALEDELVRITRGYITALTQANG